MIYQGYEDSEFWHYLGGMPDKVRPNELLSYRGPRSPRLYKICLGQGYLELPQERTLNVLFVDVLFHTEKCLCLYYYLFNVRKVKLSNISRSRKRKETTMGSCTSFTSAPIPFVF